MKARLLATDDPAWSKFLLTAHHDFFHLPSYVSLAARHDGGDPREGLVLSLLPHSVVMLNKYPYNNGHLLIAPRRHENNLANLPAEEYLELSSALQRSIEVVRQALKPGVSVRPLASITFWADEGRMSA